MKKGKAGKGIRNPAHATGIVAWGKKEEERHLSGKKSVPLTVSEKVGGGQVGRCGEEGSSKPKAFSGGGGYHSLREGVEHRHDKRSKVKNTDTTMKRRK